MTTSMKNIIEYESLKDVNYPFFQDLKKSFSETLESGWYILGDKVEIFEKEFANYTKTNFCAGVASGLDALSISLAALNLPKNSEVIVPSNTYIATILSILQQGLIPILTEPNIESYNIDPENIRKNITKNTKCLMVVHLYGKPCEMDKILEIARDFNLHIIEDCAQAHGATFKNQKTGSFGEFGAFSFYPTKNLGALGDAGAITTNNNNLIDKLKILRNYGSSKKYYNTHLGYNSRLDEIQAAFLSIKLKSLDKIISHKRSLADIYFKNLKSDFILPQRNNDFFDVFHIFNIRHPKRDELKEFLLNKGIKTEIHYPVPPHKQEALKDIFKGMSFPISEEIHRTTLSLPISYFHKNEDIYKVVDCLNQF